MSEPALAIENLGAMSTDQGWRILRGEARLSLGCLQALLRRTNLPVELVGFNEGLALLRAQVGGFIKVEGVVRPAATKDGHLALQIVQIKALGLPVTALAARFLDDALSGKPGIAAASAEHVVLDLAALLSALGLELPPLHSAVIVNGRLALSFASAADD